uniref:NADH-ubiquinone oxidoreductase chain 4L n=1 Tax=Aenictopecheidae sp. PJ-2015 TaxID=1663421 RepID=A0A3S5FQG0_9HEMI|nr:NADH dehydrogenase subunit 4L [Aenictopecheidae sp. PJ-2015]
MNFFNTLFVMFFLYLILVFCLIHKHFLLMLLMLEYLVLMIFFLLIIYLNMYYNELYFCMIYLIFTVCEGIMGLSLLVVLIRNHGNDMIKSLSFIMW